MTDDAWKQCTRDEVRRCGREKHLNKHIIRLDVVTVVFLGGCVGTGLRYASSSIADVGGFHVGTFAANMVACFVYAALSAWLGSSSLLKGRAKEYAGALCGSWLAERNKDEHADKEAIR